MQNQVHLIITNIYYIIMIIINSNCHLQLVKSENYIFYPIMNYWELLGMLKHSINDINITISLC